MIKFEYMYLDTAFFDYETIAGFHVSVGNEEDWDDVVITHITRGRQFKDHISVPVTQEWLDKVCAFIKEQTQLRPLSSWIYKKAPHTSEHQIIVEADGWYREINLYNFGEFGRHHYPEFEEDEKVLLAFFNKMQEFFMEVGIDLSFNKVKKNVLS